MARSFLIAGLVALAGLAEAALQPLPPGQLPDPATLKINADREILFAHPLPRMRCGKRNCGTYNNWELAYPGVLTTRDHDLGDALWHLRKVVWADRRQVFIDGRVLMCQLNWVRDHIHQMKGYCHWEYDLTSFLDFILDTQRADGQFYELIKQLDDFHWTFVNPDCRILYPEDNQSLVRLELEADIEYLMVEGCLQAWRTTGDDDWLRRALPRLEKGIDYQTRDVKRWDAAHGLCKRPYTIDTWDFTADPLSVRNRTIQLNEPMAIMHGDNTGVYQAMTQLAWINERFGQTAQARQWRARAATLRENTMRHLWNGRFFRHQLPLNCPPQDNNETNRLSMSDAYALNRGILTLEQRHGVIDEYRTRRQTTQAFAEWFTIDPPYEDFGPNPNHRKGQYVNGAICPFTAGELAKGAFESGCEAYGWDILERLVKMVLRDDGRVFFLYHPTTGKPQGRGPSAWGAAAILSAVDQGLAGIQDLDKLYRRMRFAPRWAVTPYTEGRYLTGYEVSRKKVDVRWNFTDKGFRYRLECPSESVEAHLLLPPGQQAARVLVNGQEMPFKIMDIFGSCYVDLTVTPSQNIADFEVLY
ncbi:MAG: hypothetical protein MJ240_08515 [Kiritimatiellae bacterium]|nr:hypothetical protein [Kiritimatiellia bacterium]